MGNIISAENRSNLLSRAKPGNPASIYIGECVCVYVCVYPSDGIHVVACGPIGTKFGTHADSSPNGSGLNKNQPRVTQGGGVGGVLWIHIYRW